jgi:signal transduction histidine kinase
VAHNLAVLVALADGGALTAPTDPQRAAGTLATIAATGRQALEEMRRVVGVLRDGGPAAAPTTELAPQPGLADIDALVEQVRAAGLEVVLRTEGTPGAWGPGAGLAAYRLVQEALTNTLKHAGPEAMVWVRLGYSAHGISVEVVDDGAGRPADRDPAADGHGLVGMVERAAAYGGQVVAGPVDGAGWRVRAFLNVRAEPVAGLP